MDAQTITTYKMAAFSVSATVWSRRGGRVRKDMACVDRAAGRQAWTTELFWLTLSLVSTVIATRGDGRCGGWTTTRVAPTDTGRPPRNRREMTGGAA